MAKKKMTASRSAVQDVERLAQRLADEQGVELVEVSLQKESRGKCLLVFIDREGGIGLDDCEKYHRALQPLVEDVDYDIMEVSSAGMDRPIKTYSSGMVARLGFSVATAWQPDILILDEVLSVGDTGFQKKCSIRMQQLIKGDATVLLVTHSPTLIAELCTKAVLMDHGRIVSSGTGAEISASYLKLLEG